MKPLNRASHSISLRLGMLAGLGLLSLLVALGGCGSGSGAPTAQPPVTQSFSGVVMGGRQPVVNAIIKIWAASPTPGGPATLLATTHTDGNGHFSGVIFDPMPSSGQIVYAVAIGGDAGSGPNSAIKLATVVGPYCMGSGCDFPDFVNINELSTVAMAYSLDGYTNLSSGTINISGPTAGPGLANAAKTFASLVSASTGRSMFQDGAACTGGGEPDNCNALRKLDTLANITAACANSNGPGSVACSGLFSETSSSTLNTFSALFNIATQATIRNNSAGIYGLAPSAAAIYSPTLNAAPHDWTLALVYTGGGLCQSEGIAVDGAGNVWVANYLPWDQPQTPIGHISKFSPLGVALSPDSTGNCILTGGFEGGGLQGSVNLAIDQYGNVWVANWNGGDGTRVSEFAPNGMPLSPTTGYTISGNSPGPYAIAIAPSGAVWVADFGNNSLTKLGASGAQIAQYKGGGMLHPVSVAVDTLGDVWTANQASASVSEFAPYAATWISPATGYTGGGLQYIPQSLALDANGNVWIPEFFGPNYPNGGSVIAELVGGNTPPASCPQSPGPGDTGCPLSSANGFMGGGLKAPDIAAVDGSGHLFVSNFHGNSLTELSVADGSALSPEDGYKNPAVNQPEGVAIDASGNVWMVNFQPHKLFKFIGLAAPVKTPLLGLPETP